MDYREGQSKGKATSGAMHGHGGIRGGAFHGGVYFLRGLSMGMQSWGDVSKAKIYLVGFYLGDVPSKP